MMASKQISKIRSTRLLLGLLFSALAIKNVLAMRPSELPDTCSPVNNYSCPAYNYCYVKPGKAPACDCFRYYGLKKTKETEGVDGEFECTIDPAPWTIGLVANIIVLILNVLVWGQVIVTTVRMKKAEVFKNNCAGRMLCLLNFNCFALIAQTVIYILGILRMDKGMFAHDVIRTYFFLPLLLCYYGVYYECVVAWIDLIQKTVTMSRTSSKKLEFFRKFLRFLLFVEVTAIIFMFLRGMLGLAIQIQAVFLLITLIITSLGGRKLASILCPDRKDTKHNNFKPAQAIRVTYRFQAWNMFIVIVSTFIVIFTIRMMNLLNLSMLIGTCGWMFAMGLSNYQWLAYIKFGNRKALEKYEQKKSGVAKMFEGLTSSVDRSSVAHTSKRASTVEPELPAVAEQDEAPAESA